MKKVTVYQSPSSGEGVEITAPGDKMMAYDPSLLQHGVLSISEYGSGQRVASFKEWGYATFDAEDHGYTITVKNPF